MRSHAADISKVAAHCREYGFVYPSSEVYGGLQGVYDYGPHGVTLKKNLRALWEESLRLHANVFFLDAAILMHPKVWEASGHVAQFHDVFVDNKDSKKRYRMDSLLESTLLEKEAKGLMQRAVAYLGAEDFSSLHQLLTDHVACPLSKTRNWTLPRKINLMFSTRAGMDEEDVVYLRPETAQGIFVNFLNVQKSLRAQLPFGVAQVGKAFRNELIVRQFLFRMREFEQMEMQFFVPPGTSDKWFSFWRDERMRWHKALGIPPEHLRYHPHEQLAHYAEQAVDIEYAFPFGMREIEGIHARGSFDLSQHERCAKKKLQYHDPTTQEHYVPHVVEVSCGLDRLCLMLLCHGLREEKPPDGGRTYLALPHVLAPVKAAIFPLVKKDGLPEKAHALQKELRYHFPVCYEEKASIGKRYARQDLIGTPYCITVDHDSMQDDKVTIRERDSMEQERIPMTQVCRYISRRVSIAEWLKRLS